MGCENEFDRRIGARPGELCGRSSWPRPREARDGPGASIGTPTRSRRRDALRSGCPPDRSSDCRVAEGRWISSSEYDVASHSAMHSSWKPFDHRAKKAPARKSPQPSPMAPPSARRAPAGHLSVVHRVSVLVHDHLGVLTVVDATGSENDDVVAGLVEAVVEPEHRKRVEVLWLVVGALPPLKPRDWKYRCSRSMWAYAIVASNRGSDLVKAKSSPVVDTSGAGPCTSTHGPTSRPPEATEVSSSFNCSSTRADGQHFAVEVGVDTALVDPRLSKGRVLQGDDGVGVEDASLWGPPKRSVPTVITRPDEASTSTVAARAGTADRRETRHTSTRIDLRGERASARRPVLAITRSPPSRGRGRRRSPSRRRSGPPSVLPARPRGLWPRPARCCHRRCGPPPRCPRPGRPSLYWRPLTWTPDDRAADRVESEVATHRYPEAAGGLAGAQPGPRLGGVPPGVDPRSPVSTPPATEGAWCMAPSAMADAGTMATANASDARSANSFRSIVRGGSPRALFSLYSGGKQAVSRTC